MSGPGNDKIPGGHQEYYPPPPPGPPPAHANPLGSNPHYATVPKQTVPPHTVPQQAAPHQNVPQHPDETPIADYNIPTYHPTGQPAQQHYGQIDPSELYDDPPTHHADDSAAKSSWSQRFAGLGTKVAAPFNALANKMGSEAFLPTTMDKECEKAARILRSFCKDGIYSDAAVPQTTTTPSQATTAPPSATNPATVDPKHPSTTTKPAADHSPSSPNKPKKPRVLLTIPSKVIARAQGLAIFTTVRAGFHVSGASGSGILIARLPDGKWSPPSGIQVHSVGAGFVVGLDIYDCVVVINTREALEAFTRTRMSLGSDLAVTAGPWGAGGMVDFGVPQGGEGKGKGKERDGRGNIGDEKPVPPVGTTDYPHPQVTTGPGTAPTAPLSAPAAGTSKDRKPSPFREAIRKPVYSYVKSRGFYAGVQIDGTVITERKDANAAFYGEKAISVDRILRGDVRPQTGEHAWPAAARGLLEVLAGAEGWRGQQGQRGPPPSVAGGAGAQHGTGAGVSSGVTEGVRHMDINAAAPPPGGPPSTYTGAQQQPPTQSYGQSAKAAEAAAEARANEPLVGAGPPSYSEPTETGHHGDELPPAYVDDGIARPGAGDVKGQH